MLFYVCGQDTKNFVVTLDCSYWHSFKYVGTVFKSALTVSVGFQATLCFEN